MNPDRLMTDAIFAMVLNIANQSGVPIYYLRGKFTWEELRDIAMHCVP
jgi:hypothetical protein